MGKIIKLGNFELDFPTSLVKNKEKYRIEQEINRLGPEWRIATLGEMKYLFSIQSRLNTLKFLEKNNLYVCGGIKNVYCYTEEEYKRLESFSIESPDADDNLFDYILVKDI
jgi:hypothetical protein